MSSSNGTIAVAERAPNWGPSPHSRTQNPQASSLTPKPTESRESLRGKKRDLLAARCMKFNVDRPDIGFGGSSAIGGESQDRSMVISRRDAA